MRFEKTSIPYGAYWSTPFCKWQGNFANLHPIKFAAETATKFLSAKKLSPEIFDGIVLGTTVPSKSGFYGAPWIAGLIGATGITGPTVSQACATSARSILCASLDIETGLRNNVLAVTCDRTSNGPHIYYPNPQGPGGMGEKEDWVWDNFGFDPFAKNSMLQTAENASAEMKIGRKEQEDLALLRHRQYADALKDESAFHRRYMITPVEVKDPSGRKVLATVADDEGIFPTTAEGLAKLAPVLKEGVVTFGTQTYPADGNAGIIVTTPARAKELSADRNIPVQLVSYGEARVKKGFMALAVVPASQQALASARIGVGDIKAIKTHNPFAVNDVILAKGLNVKLEDMNRYGCSLIYGHPQGPTGSRLVIELIEELAILGGGYGLFVGCAAGDTAAAIVIRVG